MENVAADLDNMLLEQAEAEERELASSEIDPELFEVLSSEVLSEPCIVPDDGDLTPVPCIEKLEEYPIASRYSSWRPMEPSSRTPAKQSSVRRRMMDSINKHIRKNLQSLFARDSSSSSTSPDPVLELTELSSEVSKSNFSRSQSKMSTASSDNVFVSASFYNSKNITPLTSTTSSPKKFEQAPRLLDKPQQLRPIRRFIFNASSPSFLPGPNFVLPITPENRQQHFLFDLDLSPETVEVVSKLNGQDSDSHSSTESLILAVARDHPDLNFFLPDAESE